MNSSLRHAALPGSQRTDSPIKFLTCARTRERASASAPGAELGRVASTAAGRAVGDSGLPGLRPAPVDAEDDEHGEPHPE
jgi:hypothetical protein